MNESVKAMKAAYIEFDVMLHGQIPCKSIIEARKQELRDAIRAEETRVAELRPAFPTEYEKVLKEKDETLVHMQRSYRELLHAIERITGLELAPLHHPGRLEALAECAEVSQLRAALLECVGALSYLQINALHSICNEGKVRLINFANGGLEEIEVNCWFCRANTAIAAANKALKEKP